MLLNTQMYSTGIGKTGLESLIRDLEPRKITGLLKVTFDACDGIIILDRGVVIDSYEIFNELLVKDRNGYHIRERYVIESGKIDIFEVQPEVLHTFMKMLQENPPQNLQTLFHFFMQ